MKTPISPKELKAKNLTKLVLKNKGNLAATARDLGVTKQTIRERVQKPIVQNLLRQAMADSGIDEKAIASRLKDGIDAQRRIISLTYEKVKGKMKAKKNMEMVSDLEERRKYLELVVKIRGDISPDNKDAPPAPPVLFGDVNVVAIGELEYVKILRQYTAGISNQRG